MSVNNSGLEPVEYKILIEPEDIGETDERIKSAKAAGIVMVEKTTEREAMAQVKGKLIAVGGNAFEDWLGRVPQVGDTVYFAKYAGYVVKGKDGKERRLCNDKDVAAVVTE
jgi:co-chaperonin GroES (HSP10)